MREKWTDERLDDMNERISDGFARVDQQFARVDQQFLAFRAEMNSRFEAMQRLIVQVGGGMFVTMVVGFLGVITQV